MQDVDRVRFGKTANIIIFAVSLIPVTLFLYVLFNRIGLPFSLEWGEGAGVTQILRILSDKPLYAEPDRQFAALVYTPLYYYLSAGMARIMGNVLLGARMLSAVSIIASAFLIGYLVWRESDNGLISWLAGALFIGCFALSDGFYDLARVDSLYVFTALISLASSLKANNTGKYLLFGLSLAVGFFIKQSFLILFVPFLAALLIKKHRNFWPVLFGALVGILIPVWIINNFSKGWFIYYIFQLPREHGISIVSAINFWIGDTLGPLAIAILFTAAYFFSRLRSQSENDGNLKIAENENWKEFTLGAGFILGAWLTRSSTGGGPNNVMPLYAFLAIGFGLGIDVLFKQTQNGKGVRYILIICGIFVQFIGLIYNPFNFIPTRDEVNANKDLIAFSANSQYQVLVPYRSQLIHDEDEPAQIHIVNLFELTGYFGGDIRPEGIRIINEIREDICRQEYGKVIFDQPIPWFDEQLNLTYIHLTYNERIDFTRSKQMEWQLGGDHTYAPLELADLDDCLKTIQR